MKHPLFFSLLLVAGLALCLVLPAAAGATTVKGHVYNYGGTGVAGAYVQVWSFPVFRETNTGASGGYKVTGLPATTTGDIYVSYPFTGNQLTYYPVTIPAAGTLTFDVRPGRVRWTTTRTTTGWKHPLLSVSGVDGFSNTHFPGLTGAGPFTLKCPAVPGDVDGAALFYRDNEAAEWASSYPNSVVGTVVAGATASGSIDFDEADAIWLSLVDPKWRSGPPEGPITLSLDNWSAGAVVTYRAVQEYGAYESDFGGASTVTTGVPQQAVAMPIPGGAVSGYELRIQAHKQNGVTLAVSYQVCTLRAAPASIAVGGSVRLSGVVPVGGHWGNQAGTPRAVTIYRTTTAPSGHPASWDPTSAGWKKVATVMTDGYGRYHKTGLHPKVDTWYVVRYPGGGGYRRAFTGVTQITVF